MDRPEDEKRFLNNSFHEKKVDKFQGFNQFVEKKLMEEKGPEEEQKPTIITGIKNMVSMRRIGSIFGLSKQDYDHKGFLNQVSASNTTRNSMISPTRTFLVSTHGTMNKLELMVVPNKESSLIRASRRFVISNKIVVERKSKSLMNQPINLEYYEKRLAFLKKTFLDNYPTYNTKNFKHLLLTDRDFCEKQKEKFQKKEKKEVKEGIAKLQTFSKSWKEKAMKIKKASVYGSFNSYHLKQMIIKGGDDLRQEMIAMQLMKKFKEIFDKESTGCYLAPYDIIATSSDSGFLEFLTDTIPIDNLKKTHKLKLAEIYELIYSDCFETARKNFIMSLAGYSLYAYLLQIKDRHNGNILISSEGHVLHIDFGFMFTTSPGNINFESAPFKLTKVN